MNADLLSVSIPPSVRWSGNAAILKPTLAVIGTSGSETITKSASLGSAGSDIIFTLSDNETSCFVAYVKGVSIASVAEDASAEVQLAGEETLPGLPGPVSTLFVRAAEPELNSKMLQTWKEWVEWCAAEKPSVSPSTVSGSGSGWDPTSIPQSATSATGSGTGSGSGTAVPGTPSAAVPAAVAKKGKVHPSMKKDLEQDPGFAVLCDVLSDIILGLGPSKESRGGLSRADYRKLLLQELHSYLNQFPVTTPPSDAAAVVAALSATPPAAPGGNGEGSDAVDGTALGPAPAPAPAAAAPVHHYGGGSESGHVEAQAYNQQQHYYDQQQQQQQHYYDQRPPQMTQWYGSGNDLSSVHNPHLREAGASPGAGAGAGGGSSMMSAFPRAAARMAGALFRGSSHSPIASSTPTGGMSSSRSSQRGGRSSYRGGGDDVSVSGGNGNGPAPMRDEYASMVNQLQRVQSELADIQRVQSKTHGRGMAQMPQMPQMPVATVTVPVDPAAAAAGHNMGMMGYSSYNMGPATATGAAPYGYTAVPMSMAMPGVTGMPMPMGQMGQMGHMGGPSSGMTGAGYPMRMPGYPSGSFVMTTMPGGMAMGPMTYGYTMAPDGSGMMTVAMPAQQAAMQSQQDGE